MKDYILRGINKNNTMRIFIGDTTNTVEEARKIHGSSATSTAALGRALTGALLMGQELKEELHTLTLNIKGDGPLGNIVCVANGKGQVKAYVDRPLVDLPTRSDGKLDVGSVVGKQGYITVIRDLGLKEAYTGQTPLVSGEIAEDLANYYYISEQQPSAINLGVLVDRDLSVLSAGGYMLQLMPNVSEEEIEELEEILKKSQPISALLNEGNKPEDILKKLFSSLDFKILDKTEVEFKCNCSRDRMEKALISLGRSEIESLISEGEAELQCHFCNKKHTFSVENLKELINEI